MSGQGRRERVIMTALLRRQYFYNEFCVRQLPVTIAKCLRQLTAKEKRLFCLPVWGVPACAQLALSFGLVKQCVTAGHQGANRLSSSQARKQRENEVRPPQTLQGAPQGSRPPTHSHHLPLVPPGTQGPHGSWGDTRGPATAEPGAPVRASRGAEQAAAK